MARPKISLLLSSSSGRTRDLVAELTHKNCRLGAVQTREDGWGFVVSNERGKPLVSLTYETEAEAEEARSLMAEVILLVAITPSPQ